jgi:outer membrane protein assembly factor BamD (BamD/ComL family)
LAACAPHVGDAFARAKAAGDDAYSSGRFDEAALKYEAAASASLRATDRAEALYLRAASYQRERSWEKARVAFARLIKEQPQSQRARRASFDLAAMEIDAGNRASGYELLRDAMMKQPDDGLARRAFLRYLEYLDQNGTDSLTWLRSVEPALASTELDENVLYAIAERQEKSGELDRARDSYLSCADRHPYPQGSLFDDALWHASLADEKLSRPQQAIDDLERMLRVREPSSVTGSYERPRFSPARYRVAVLYRDKLGNHAEARRQFHALYAEHPTSILRDDALWEEAKLALADGDEREACALTATLAKDFPTSRYAACARALCATALPTQGSRCHEYITRRPDG